MGVAVSSSSGNTVSVWRQVYELWNTHSRDRSFSRLFVHMVENFRSQERMNPGPFVPRTIRSQEKSFETSFFSAVPGLAVPTKSS